jgi:hypothetical protein
MSMRNATLPFLGSEPEALVKSERHPHQDYASEEAYGEQSYEQMEESHPHHHHNHAAEGSTKQEESRSGSAFVTLPDGQHRVQLACLRCRKQKLKCDGASPACSRCVNRNTDCVYSSEPTGRKNGSKKKTGRRGARKDEAAAAAAATGALVTKNSSTGVERGLKDFVVPSERPPPQLVALEQLSRKLKMELDSYSGMAKHWQEQLNLLKKGGVSAVTDKQAVAWLRREMKPKMPKEKSGRPQYLPESRTAGESWTSFTSESHPAIHLAQSMVAFGDRALVANPIQTIQDPAQVDFRCHRFRMMRFWDMTSPRDLLTEDLSYDTLVAAWDILLQPISTVIQGNAFVDDIGRHLEDDLEEKRTLDSIAIFAHTAELEEVLTVMEFGVLFFHATQLVGWDSQMDHLVTNVDRLLQVAFFQRGLSGVPELADRTINFITWYVWRYKAFKMMSAYKSLLNLGYQTLLSNFSHVSPSIAAALNTLLITTVSNHAQLMHHVHLAERIEHTPLKKALVGLAIAIVTLNHADSPIHQYEKLENDYPELLRVIDLVENPFDPGNHAISATALFLHAEVLVRLGRDIRIVEELLDGAIRDVVNTEACNAIHLLFSNMFMFQATVNTVVQFSNGVTCTVSDYARIELAKALGFPLSQCPNIHQKPNHTEAPCSLKFGSEFQQAFARMGQLQPCDGQCGPNNEHAEQGHMCSQEPCSSEVVTPNSEAHTHHHYSSPQADTLASETCPHAQFTSMSSSSSSMMASSSSSSMMASSSSSTVNHPPHSYGNPEPSPGWSSTSSPFVSSPAFASSPSMQGDQESVSVSSTYFAEDYSASEPLSEPVTFPSQLGDSGIFFNDGSHQLEHPTFSLSMSGDQLAPWTTSGFQDDF